MFHVGDRVVYPSQGLTQVMGIEQKTVSGKDICFYLLRTRSGAVIQVPVAKAEGVGIRAPVSKEDAEAAIDVLRHESPTTSRETWNRRYRGFMEKVKAGNLFDVAEVLRDLARLKRTKTLSFSENRMLGTVRLLFVEEVAFVQSLSFMEVERLIDEATGQTRAAA